MKGQNLPRDHHVVRLVSHGKLEKDEDGKPIGILFSAFQLRPAETGLSVTWMEYFPGTRGEQIASTIKAIRASTIKPSPQSGFAIGKVGAIADACTERNHKIRIVHWPEDDNKAHAEIRQLPRDDRILLDQLASAAWSELVLNAAVPKGEQSAPEQAACTIP